MNPRMVAALKRVSRGIDRVAQTGHHRFVREKEAGLAYGEHVLRQLFDLFDFDAVFDVGANVGQYAQHLRRDVGYRGPIVSFEPMPAAAARLREEAAQDGRWRVLECAIDQTAGSARFNVMQGDEFSSLLAPNIEFDGRFHGSHHVASTIDVEVITLIDAVAKVPAFGCGLLKLDTQGTELRLLRGAGDVLHRFPALQTEVAFKPLYDGGETFDAALAQLGGAGYELCALFPNNHGHFPHLVEMDAVFLRREHMPALA